MPKKVIPGVNDLATTHPELAKEAHGWDPRTVLAGTNKKLDWKCEKGHVYPAVGSSRSRFGTGCKFCSNWEVLPGYNDLATTQPELAKEAHGWDPTTVIAGTDKKLDWQCDKGHVYSMRVANRTGSSRHGCKICSNQELLSGYNDLATTHPELAKEAHGWDPTTVFAGSDKKLDWKCDKGHVYPMRVANRTSSGRHGCKFCSNNEVLAGFNDLATTHPELAKEAHGWDPTIVLAGTNKKLDWKCEKGHVYPMSAAHRSSGRGCKFCSNREVLPGYNDLATTHPELAKEAHGWDPRTVLAGTGKKLDWKCEKGHVYPMTGANRFYGSGCPDCAPSGYSPEKDGWMYLMERPSEQQFGISNVIEKRIKRHERASWSFVEQIGPFRGDSVLDCENKIKKWLKDSIGTSKGSKEAWSTQSLEVGSLSDLFLKADVSMARLQPATGDLG
jgi:hypothetical protein